MPTTKTARFTDLDPTKSYALYSPDGDEITRGYAGGLAMNQRWEPGTEAYEEPARCIDDDGEPLPADAVAE
jgi:hypothetical protein